MELGIRTPSLFSVKRNSSTSAEPVDETIVIALVRPRNGGISPFLGGSCQASHGWAIIGKRGRSLAQHPCQRACHACNRVTNRVSFSMPAAPESSPAADAAEDSSRTPRSERSRHGTAARGPGLEQASVNRLDVSSEGFVALASEETSKVWWRPARRWGERADKDPARSEDPSDLGQSGRDARPEMQIVDGEDGMHRSRGYRKVRSCASMEPEPTLFDGGGVSFASVVMHDSGGIDASHVSVGTASRIRCSATPGPNPISRTFARGSSSSSLIASFAMPVPARAISLAAACPADPRGWTNMSYMLTVPAHVMWGPDVDRSARPCPPPG